MRVMARRRKPPPLLHKLEAEIMDAVWSAGDEMTVRQVMDELNARSSPDRAYTTFMTVMTRLDEKGLLTRRRQGKTDVYRALLSREEYAAARAEAEVGALVDQFGDVALTHFARRMAALDPERRRELQRLARKS
jgi:BlaI family transcriptional regulator, penicillinase repressor